MAAGALKKKPTPEVVGQLSARRSLAESLRSGRAAHAYLLSGPKGIGKTAVALEFAQLLLCDRNDLTPCGECIQCTNLRTLQHADLKILFPLPPLPSGKLVEDEEKEFGQQISKVVADLATDRYAHSLPPKAKEIRLGLIRPLLRAAAMKPYQARRKVFVLLHADAMNDQSQNALLKTLEEPYPDSHFILVTDSESTLRPTIRSRCQRLHLTPLTRAEVYDALIADGTPSDQAELAAQLSGGSFVHARELAGPDIESVQNNVVTFLRQAAICDPLELPQAAADLLDNKSLPEFTGLEMMGLFLRDAAVFRAVSDTDRKRRLTFGNLEDKIHGIITAYPHADFERAIRAVDESTDHLARGYTKDMVLYALAIRLNEALGTWVKTKRTTPVS